MSIPENDSYIPSKAVITSPASSRKPSSQVCAQNTDVLRCWKVPLLYATVWTPTVLREFQQQPPPITVPWQENSIWEAAQYKQCMAILDWNGHVDKACNISPHQGRLNTTKMSTATKQKVLSQKENLFKEHIGLPEGIPFMTRHDTWQPTDNTRLQTKKCQGGKAKGNQTRDGRVVNKFRPQYEYTAQHRLTTIVLAIYCCTVTCLALVHVVPWCIYF